MKDGLSYNFTDRPHDQVLPDFDDHRPPSFLREKIKQEFTDNAVAQLRSIRAKLPRNLSFFF
jgi:hypothetical protein